MSGAADAPVFIIVIAARFLVPLGIPRFPLPALIAAMVLDAVDQTVFETFTTREFPGYQGYDKALDVYYLTIAYISTLRNWKPGPAFEVGRALWYYRLAGVVAFNISEARALLLIFPNTFEYYFIAYEVFRLRWNPDRLTWRHAVGAAAFLWIGVKLPQEWWIHIAKLDFTDFVGENPWLIAVFAVLGLAAVLAWRRYGHLLPPPDRRPHVHIPFGSGAGSDVLPSGISRAERIARGPLLEKIALVAMVSVIFAQVLPNATATNLQLSGAVAFVVFANAVFTHILARLGTGWFTWKVEFAVMSVVNFAIAVAYVFLIRRYSGSLDLGTTLFFVLLLTLIVMSFDRYHLERITPREEVAAANSGTVLTSPT